MENGALTYRLSKYDKQIIEDLEDSPDKECPAPRKTEDVECASAQGQEQVKYP